MSPQGLIRELRSIREHCLSAVAPPQDAPPGDHMQFLAKFAVGTMLSWPFLLIWLLVCAAAIAFEVSS